MLIDVTTHRISAGIITRRVRGNSHGAVVTFSGVIRDNSEGKKVLTVEYEAYREMAEKELRRIGEEIKQKWGLEDVALVHRTGKLNIGETAVVIAVGAPHRKAAFQACEYAIDRIKQIVPIWKKETFEGGESWAEGQLSQG
jgi:molybdopterin synthase catalytic subunit